VSAEPQRAQVWAAVVGRDPASRRFDDAREVGWVATLWSSPGLPESMPESWSRARLLAVAQHASWLASWVTCDPDDSASVERLRAQVEEIETTARGLRVALDAEDES